LALKKAAFPPSFLLTKWDIKNKTPKYRAIKVSIKVGVMRMIILKTPK
jgi:hypothetical protein